MSPQDNSRHSILSKEGEWVPSPSAPGEYGPKPSASALMTTADTFVLLVGERSPLLRRVMWSPIDFMDSNEAVDFIGEIERGERKGIVGDLCAYKDGSYIGTIPTAHTAACIREGQQSARDDAEHTRRWTGSGGL